MAKKLMELITVSALLVGATYGATTYEDLSPMGNAQAAPPPAEIAVVKPVPAMPKGYDPGQAVRDPFAVPPEFAAPAAASLPDAAQAMAGSGAAGVKGAKASEARPMLAGVVQSGERRAAIIQMGTDSRTYRVGDYLGAYQVTNISSHSVTLSGPTGDTVLTLGR